MGLTLFGDLAYAELLGARTAAWAPPPAGLGWGASSEQPPLTMLFESAPLLMVVTFLDRRPGRGGRVGDWLRRFRVRWLWLAVGACLHLGIALTLRLGIFPFGVLALYPLLLHPEELEQGARRWRRRAGSPAGLAEFG